MPLPTSTEPTATDRLTLNASNGASHSHNVASKGATVAGALNQVTLNAVADALSRLRYGAVHLTVHDGKVVQLDVTERQRFT